MCVCARVCICVCVYRLIQLTTVARVSITFSNTAKKFSLVFHKSSYRGIWQKCHENTFLHANRTYRVKLSVHFRRKWRVWFRHSLILLLHRGFYADVANYRAGHHQTRRIRGRRVGLTGFVEDLGGLLLNALPAAFQLVLSVLQLHHPDFAILDGLLQLLVQVLSDKQTDYKY